MSLTKATYSMVSGAPVNVFDFMTSAQIASVQARDLSVDVTAAIQSAINYCFANGHRQLVFPSGTYFVSPTLQPDGTYVCLLVNDNDPATASFNIPGIFLEGESDVWLSSTENVHVHTIMRWKASNSGMARINFTGVRTKTVALEFSRIRQDAAGVFSRSDESSYGSFSDLWFKNVIRAITMEGSVYYNTFTNIHGYAVDQLLWLKLPYLFTSTGVGYQSGVNRNNFYNMTSLAGINGIKVDCGDTNKFYNCSFEGLSGIAVEVFDMNATYPVVENTNYNTFYGITNEANTQDLNYYGLAGMNSFIDFESNFSKCYFNAQPQVFIQSGSSNNHLFFKDIVNTDDQDILTYIKNRIYTNRSLYVGDVSDYNGYGTDGKLKGYGWRYYPVAPTDCTNVATIQYNNSQITSNPIYKSIGGVIYYILKMGFTVSNTANPIIIPVPYAGWNATYSYGNSIPMGMPVSYSANSGALQTLQAAFDGNTLTIQAPSGGWNGTKNIILVNIFYPRSDITVNADTN